MCKIGALLVIWPDKKVLNTETMEFKSLEAEFTTLSDVSYTLCRADGTAYENYEVGITAPDTPCLLYTSFCGVLYRFYAWTLLLQFCKTVKSCTAVLAAI